ncbi:MAG: EAL domain-containing protein, partial [Chloroflexota bacterium]|nr:EAL domain-containing protein [Chloroflexota bacterium]
RLEQAALAARRENRQVAALLIDLDRFKEVNDAFGHHHGDLLLKEVSRRLRQAVRESDTVARLGGDEFAVVLPNCDLESARTSATSILKALDEPFVVEREAVSVSASIGVVAYPDHGEDSETLMRHADVAMYAAKREGDGIAVFAFEQEVSSASRLTLTNELRRAIDSQELVPYYQPKMSLRDGGLVGVEALVRWRHPARGLVLPDEFIPLAEQTGLIKPLTMRVVSAVLKQHRLWQAAGIELTVAINLSMRNLHDPQLPEIVASLLEDFGIPASALQLEITETVLMTNPARALDVVTRLSGMGIHLSIDDFGTGYSSLAYLKRLPVKEIKIDKSFVHDMATDENDATIVRSTIDLGHNLGLQVVAEGVENSV